MTPAPASTLLPLRDVVDRFNAVSPIPRSTRTIQRWLARHGIEGAGTSRQNWFYLEDEVDQALRTDFGAGKQ